MAKKIKISEKGKLVFKIYLYLSFFVLIGFIIFIAFSYAGSNYNFEYINKNFYAIGDEDPSFFIDETTGEYYFIKDDVEDFKILQLTDTHIGGGFSSHTLDMKAFDAMFSMIRHTEPDLIVITGDVIYPFLFQSGNTNNEKLFEQVIMFMEKLQIPWTVALGNHDTEIYCMLDREGVADMLASKDLKYCMFQKNPENVDVTGYGNYYINIRNSDNSINNTLFVLDSNSTKPGTLFDYDKIHDDQVLWYRNTVNRLSTPANGVANGEVVKSLMFTHIPFTEYEEAWRMYNNGSSDVELLYGGAEDKILAHKPTPKDPKSKIFESIVDLGSTKGVFVGHNHRNTFALVYKGVQLTYSKSIVYLGLHGVDKNDEWRGGTLININSDGDFVSTSIGIGEVERYEGKDIR